MSLPTLDALQARGAVDASQAEDRNCITIFLVGSPGQLDTWDMKPDAPAEVRGKFTPIATNVPRHADLRALPADGADDGQGGADPQPAPQHRRDARKRPALDDDRPRLQRRQREAAHRQRSISRVFGPKGDLPANVILPGTIGNTGAGPLHGQTAAYLGSAHEPFFLNADPARPDFKVADLEAPPADHAESAHRRPPASCSDSSTTCSAGPRLAATQMPRQLRTHGPSPADVAAKRRRRSTSNDGTRQAPRPLRPQHVRPKLPDGPPADRSGRALRHGQPLRHGVQSLLLGHARRRRRLEQHLPRLRTASSARSSIWPSPR